MARPDSDANGIVLIDKPGGITSHDVVARLRRVLGTRKIGHAGTLDPMATGLLILGVGPSTRLLTHLVGLDKVYRATIRLGQATTTDDAEGETTATHSATAVTDAALTAALAKQTGPILQRPSAVSAIKVDGVRAYDRVRAGEDVQLPARPVVVHALRLLSGPVPAGDLLDLEAEVACSSGTYIRAIARGLGEELGVGGHLTALRRISVGPFGVQEAEELPARDAPDGLVRLLEPAEAAARLFPVVTLTAAQAADLAHGKQLILDHPDAAPVAAVAADPAGSGGRLVGLIEIRGGRSRVLTNFPAMPAAVTRED